MSETNLGRPQVAFNTKGENFFEPDLRLLA